MTAPRLVIRADADAGIGTGHVMRCLALAGAWQALGGEAIFAGCIAPESLRLRIGEAGYALVALPSRYPEPSDLSTMQRMAPGSSADDVARVWLALDGYHFDPTYHQALREAGFSLLLIDDLAHLADYRCDALLNQNLYAANLAYRDAVSGGAIMMLGPRYALLRPEFSSEGQQRLFPDMASKVLVTMGGADQHNVTALVLGALKAMGVGGLEVKAVIGAANQHREVLSGIRDALSYPCELLEDVDDMAQLMCWADMAITAAGSTTYELAAVGVPFLTIVTADNQERNAGCLAEQGVATSLGWHHCLAHESLAAQLRSFMGDRELRRNQSQRGMHLVDGQGAARVALAMQSLGMNLRPAEGVDSEILLAWANDQDTRRNSFCQNPIGRAEHQRWLAEKLSSKDCRLWLAELPGGRLAGMVRFDRSGDEAEISVNLAPEFRGMGLGGRLIHTACSRVFREEDGISRISALVKPANSASLRAFVSAGFEEVGETEHHGATALSLRLVRDSHG